MGADLASPVLKKSEREDWVQEKFGCGGARKYSRDFSLQAIIKVSNSFSATEILAAPPHSFAQNFLVMCATSVRLQSDGR